ncbi:MAG TPA: hypothetical protein VMH22_07515 [bacterium]|nr:hypothetical protein [bacterium]
MPDKIKRFANWNVKCDTERMQAALDTMQPGHQSAMTPTLMSYTKGSRS